MNWKRIRNRIFVTGCNWLLFTILSYGQIDLNKMVTYNDLIYLRDNELFIELADLNAVQEKDRCVRQDEVGVYLKIVPITGYAANQLVPRESLVRAVDDYYPNGDVLSTFNEQETIDPWSSTSGDGNGAWGINYTIVRDGNWSAQFVNPLLNWTSTAAWLMPLEAPSLNFTLTFWYYKVFDTDVNWYLSGTTRDGERYPLNQVGTWTLWTLNVTMREGISFFTIAFDTPTLSNFIIDGVRLTPR